ncbi:9659_t:CDS:1, partial [Ambispora leptoticha]
WMKKEEITNIRLDSTSNQLVVEFSNHNSKTLKNNELSAEQKELRNFFMQNPHKKSFSRSELEKLGNVEGQNPKNKGDKVITGLIVTGIILMVVAIIGVAVYK